jgi:nitroreductase
MSKKDLFFSRRSVRAFTDAPISREQLQDLLSAAMSAPSACAKDPWRFHVITNKKLLAEIAEALPNGKFLAQAPAGILVCGDIAVAHGNELSYMLQDCSAAIENLLLAVTALELGACWLGVHPRSERIEYLKALFNLPENIIPLSVIALGHPQKVPAPRNRYNSEYVNWHE